MTTSNARNSHTDTSQNRETPRMPPRAKVPTLTPAPHDPNGTSRETPECGSMIVVRPEREGGVIFRCDRDLDHAGEHTSGGMAEEFPLVENTSDLPFLVRWSK